MTKENKFLLLSLNQKESKNLAQTLSNETSRKILDYLTEKQEASASEISKKLNVPLPTIHYNLKHLVKANLVESKEFRWSKKGKEMDIYRLAKKLVIIAPKSTSLKEIKNLLPIAIISVVAGFLVKLFTQTNRVGATIKENTQMLTETATTDYVMIQTNLYNLPWFWFIIGAFFVIILIIIWRLKK